jgi:Tfp pilus assembly protein PilX
MKIIRNNDGMVLVLAALLIVVLSVIGFAANRNVVTDTVVGSNHLSSVQSFYVAEAGLELGQAECMQRFITYDWANFTPILDGTSTTSLTGLIFDTPRTLYGGTYTVTISNDAADAGGPSTDTNRTISFVSTGTFDTSLTTLKSSIHMNTIPKLPGAVNLVNDANVGISGNAFKIDGRDFKITDPDDAPSGTAAHRLGIALCGTPQTPQDVKDRIPHYENIKGLNTGIGTSIGVSSELTAAMLNEFADNVRAGAHYTNVLQYGTQSTPKITYISNQTMTINPQLSVVGAGILVIDGANHDLIISGDFNWVGTVLIVGGKFRVNGGGSAKIIGSLIVGGGADSPLELDINGNARIEYSREGMDKVNQALMNSKGRYKVIAWQRVTS